MRSGELLGLEIQQMKSTDIAGYTFNADQYCVDCILTALSGVKENIGYAFSVEGVLDQIAGAMHIDRMDERSFDSGEFPKVIFDSQIEDKEYCGNCKGELR
jgi:hypothetical protein